MSSARCGGFAKALLAAYVLAAALLPLAHHDILCHLKSSTHCTTCAAASSGETAASTVGLDGTGLARCRPRDPSVVCLPPSSARSRVIRTISANSRLTATLRSFVIRACGPGHRLEFNGNPIPIAWRYRWLRRFQSSGPCASSCARAASWDCRSRPRHRRRRRPLKRKNVREELDKLRKEFECRSRRVWREARRTRRKADGHGRAGTSCRSRAADRSGAGGGNPTEAPVPTGAGRERRAARARCRSTATRARCRRSSTPTWP